MVSLLTSVSRGSDHQAEVNRAGLQGELFACQSLQIRPEKVPLQRGQHHATGERSSSVLPAALSGVGRSSRWEAFPLSLEPVHHSETQLLITVFTVVLSDCLRLLLAGLAASHCCGFAGDLLTFQQHGELSTCLPDTPCSYHRVEKKSRECE